MSTIVQGNIEDSRESSSRLPAPKKVLKQTYDKVIAALNRREKVILITGNLSKGKTALLHTICKDISASNRIISLAGKDIPENNNHDESELNDILEFILASTDLDESLVITVDDAHLFPIKHLSKLLAASKTSSHNDHPLQILLTGPAGFKEQLVSIDSADENTLLHYTMNTLTKKEILTYAKNKDYKISSNIKNLEFASNSLDELAEFIQSDKEVLDVILDWCAALTKKDQLNKINSETILRACQFAQQFSRDRGLHLANAHPPSHEVYKFINEHKASQPPREKPIEKSINKNIKSHAIPTIKPAIIESHVYKKDEIKQKEAAIQNYVTHDPLKPKWTPASKKASRTNKSLIAYVGMLSAILLSYIIYIGYQTGTNQPPDALKIESKNNIPSDKQSATKNSVQTKSIIVVEEKEIAPNKINRQEIKKPFVAPLILDDLTLADSELTSNLIKHKSNETISAVEINRLLLLAENQINEKKLSTPINDNALETYQQLLKKAPNNPLAIAGINNIHDKYMSWADYYSKRNDFARAERFYSRALNINPTNKAAISGLEAIQNKRSTSESSQPLNAEEEITQDILTAGEVLELLKQADERMNVLENKLSQNERIFRLFQEAQSAYLDVLRYEPSNQYAKNRLGSLGDYYAQWAEQETIKQNYNIAIFLYGNALNLQPENAQLSDRIQQVRKLRDAL